MTDNAPAPQPVITPTDTTGMTPSQAEAMRYVDSVKPEILKGTSNAQLLARNTEALAHVFHNGPAPAWLQEPSGAAKAEAARQVDPDSVSGLHAAFTPMQASDVDGLVQHAVVATSLPREHAERAAGFALEAQLPAGVAKGLIDRLAHHRQHGGGLDAAPLDAAEQEDLRQEAVRSLGGPEKAANEVRLARAYLESVGGAKLLAQVDNKAGSIGFDPRVILALSMLARSRGLA